MSENQTQTYLNEAGTLLEKGDYQDALVAYQKVADIDPACGEAWLMLGSICGELGQLDKAMDYLQHSIELDPDDSAALHALGQVKYALGDTEAAITCFNKAAVTGPDDPLIQCALGEIYHQKGDLENAVTCYEKAMACDQPPEQGWAMLGYLQLQQGNLPRAEECYRTAIYADSKDVATITGWCTVVAKIDRPDDADALLQTLLDSNPSDHEICFQLAMTCSELGRHAEALHCINDALQGTPGGDMYLLGKAEILERKGDLPDCFEILKPYLQSQPVNPNAVLIFAKFSHIVGLKNECIQLLHAVLSSENLIPEIRTEASAALDWVNRTEVSGSTP